MLPSSALSDLDVLVRLGHVTVIRDGEAVLEDVSLELLAKRIVTVVGPNGSGKSTLAKVVVDLIKPTSGTRWVAAGVRMGYMPQHLVIPTAMPLRVRDFLGLVDPHRQAIEAMAQFVGVAALLDRQVMHLSGGERQRVLLGHALMNNPQLVVLDEPLQGLDVSAQVEIGALIRSLPETRQCAVFMVSHDPEWVLTGTDEVICLNHHICCEGSPDTVMQHPLYVQLFGEQSPYRHYTHKHACEHDDPCLKPDGSLSETPQC